MKKSTYKNYNSKDIKPLSKRAIKKLLLDNDPMLDKKSENVRVIER